jgi:hypothetical protein
MAEPTEVVDPVEENSTPEAPAEEEQAPTSEETPETEPEDNGEAEDQEPAPSDDKEERWKQQLQGSKAEALRLKSELDELKTMKETIEEKTDADIPITDADLAAFNALAKKLGFVTKKEIERDNQVRTYSQTQEDSLNKFLSEHPEYNKIGDGDSDKKWTELQQELTLYNSRPTDPKTWYKILKRAHNNLNNNSELAKAKGESLGMAKANLAEQAKTGNRALGGVSTPTGKRTPEQQQLAREVEDQMKKTSWYKPQ